MGKVIEFPKKRQTAAPVVAVFVSGDDITQAERMERIKASLMRINQLMEELKQTTRRIDE